MNSLIVALIPLLMQIESNHNPNAIGDNGTAFGILQIREIYIKDVNRIYGTNFKVSDAYNVEKSIEITTLYLKHYGKRYEKLTGNTANMEILARIHNGGPNGFKKSATLPYLRKLKNFQNRLNN